MKFISQDGIVVKYNPFWKRYLLPPQLPLYKYNKHEVAMGIDVEMVHTENPEIALYITFNHLDEFPDYYSRLKIMEEEAERGLE